MAPSIHFIHPFMIGRQPGATESNAKGEWYQNNCSLTSYPVSFNLPFPDSNYIVTYSQPYELAHLSLSHLNESVNATAIRADLQHFPQYLAASECYGTPVVLQHLPYHLVASECYGTSIVLQHFLPNINTTQIPSP